MTDELAWTMYYTGVASIRLHPRNSALKKTDRLKFELELAAYIADEMLKHHRSRYKCSDSAQSSEAHSAPSAPSSEEPK